MVRGVLNSALIFTAKVGRIRSRESRRVSRGRHLLASLWCVANEMLASFAVASTGFHTARLCLGAAPPAAACRTQTLVAQYDEDMAKAAWLAKLEEPSWGPGALDMPGGPYAPGPAYAAHAPTNAWLMPGAPVLTLEAADQMSNVALQEASARGFNPVSVCVMDTAGRILVAKTMLGVGTLTPSLAISKANACIGLLCSSRELRDKYVNDDGIGPKMPQLLAFETVAAAANQPIGAFPGGVLCRDAANNVICAIGVSGAASDEDEHCAILAAQSVGLMTDPAASRLV